jgi:ABC-type Na+ efflux pump permease subunit
MSEEKKIITPLQDATWTLALTFILMLVLFQGFLLGITLNCFLIAFFKFSVWKSRYPENHDRRAMFFAIAYVLVGFAYICMMIYNGVISL